MTPKQLKASILQLAIQGKLVPQDPNDEPASELLKRIEATKNAKTAKKPKPLPPITDDEKPFSIPDSWQWVRLGEIANVVTGATPSKSNSSLYGGNYKFFKPADLDAGYNVVSASDRLTNAGWEICRQLPKDSVLVTCIGSIGKAGIIRDCGTCNQQINALIPVLAISEFIYFVILSEWFQAIMKESSGKTTLSILNKFTFQQLPFPLPPLAEQKRIVAKVEALFKYVDECEDSRKQLAEKLAEALKRSVLQEAIQGRLVPQDPNDEPASELLKRIEAAKDAKTAKKPKHLPPITDDEKPFPIPDSWQWVRLGELVEVLSGVSYDKKDVGRGSVRVLRGGNIKDDYTLNFHDDDVFLPQEYGNADSVVKVDDIVLVGSTGSANVIGRPAIASEKDVGVQIGAFLRIVRPSNESANWIHSIFRSEFYRGHIREVSRGTNIKNLKREYIADFAIPLPPLAEQKRIVAKVETLLAKVEKIKEAAK